MIEYLLKMNVAAYDAVRTEFRLGMTEKDIEAIILNTYKSVAGDNYTFCGDVIGGKRTAEIEGGAGNYVLKVGDALILDLQPQIEDTFCDTTRTFFIGQPDDEMREAYNKVSNTLLMLEHFFKPNVKACEIYSEMDKISGKYGYKCPHHAGNIIGKNRSIVPEFLPDVSDNIKAGNVVALEPGFYKKNRFGIRLENNYKLTSSGIVNLFDYSLNIENFILGV